MTETVQTERKKRGVGKSKFSNRFKPLDIPLHGVRLPTFTPEKKYLEEYGVDESDSNLEFLKQICRKRFKDLKL